MTDGDFSIKIREYSMLEEETDEALMFAERRRSDRRKLIVGVSYEGSDTTMLAYAKISIGGLSMTTRWQVGTQHLRAAGHEGISFTC